MTFIADDIFLERIKRAYRHAVSVEGRPPLLSLWRRISDRQRDIQDALVDDSNDALRALFADPGGSDLFYGVDNLCRSVETSKEGETALATGLYKDADLDRHPFSFPTPFPGEVGVRTFSGVATYRAILSAYQALRVQELARGPVLEIGPGLGRVALHARQLGVLDYTTVDLPMGIVAQACFLGATLGPDQVWFSTDPYPADGRIRLMSFADLRREARRYSVVLNADSIVEMDHITAARYARWIGRHADVFLSINRDYRRMKVRYLAALFFRAAQATFSEFKLRPGYISGVYRFR